MKNNSRIAILATDGFEQSELMNPLNHFKDKNATVEILAPSGKTEIKGWDQGNWGESVKVDREVQSASVDNYDALILPGGQMNPDVLRADKNAMDFISAFTKTNKPIAAICHAPWLLAETGAAKGKNLTSYSSIKTDMQNAGANWKNEACVVDGNLITSRNPDDLPAFNAAIEKALS